MSTGQVTLPAWLLSITSMLKALMGINLQLKSGPVSCPWNWPHLHASFPDQWALILNLSLSDP